MLSIDPWRWLDQLLYLWSKASHLAVVLLSLQHAAGFVLQFDLSDFHQETSDLLNLASGICP